MRAMGGRAVSLSPNEGNRYPRGLPRAPALGVGIVPGDLHLVGMRTRLPGELGRDILSPLGRFARVQALVVGESGGPALFRRADVVDFLSVQCDKQGRRILQHKDITVRGVREAHGNHELFRVGLETEISFLSGVVVMLCASPL